MGFTRAFQIKKKHGEERSEARKVDVAIDSASRKNDTKPVCCSADSLTFATMMRLTKRMRTRSNDRTLFTEYRLGWFISWASGRGTVHRKRSDLTRWLKKRTPLIFRGRLILLGLLGAPTKLIFRPQIFFSLESSFGELYFSKFFRRFSFSKTIKLRLVWPKIA